jgi:transcriptional regulator with XRE-family HTH domain
MARGQETHMEEALNDRLKALMKEKGLNQKQLAERTHLSEGAMSRYLSGDRTPHLEILVNLAHTLNVTTDCLLGVEVASPQENYGKIYDLIKRNKADFSTEERIKLIQLLSL